MIDEPRRRADQPAAGAGTPPAGAGTPPAGAGTPAGLPISRRAFVAGSAALVGSAALGLAGCGSSGGLAALPTSSADITPRWILVSIAGLTHGLPRWVEFDIPAAQGVATPQAPGVVGSSATASEPTPVLPTGTPADSLPSTRGGAWLAPQADGTVAAFAPHCPHRLCLYDWDTPAGEFRCRCHPGLFRVDGSVISGPPPRPLWRYETRPAGPDAIELGWVASP